MTLSRSELHSRFRSLADDCEERARLDGCNPVAMLDYQRAARTARRWLGDRVASDADLVSALNALEALRKVARWHDGEADPFGPENGSGESLEPIASPAFAPVAGEPRELLNSRQLGALFAMSENGAREAIKRGLRRRLDGFDRDGALYFADPVAFAALPRKARKCGIGEGQGASPKQAP